MRILFAALFALFATNASAAPKRYRLDDDAAIAAAVKAVANVVLDEESAHCTQRMNAPFDKVVLIGTFAYDRGCRGIGYFADGAWVSGRDDAAPALMLAGWADTSKRALLALRWAEAALLQTSLRANVNGGEATAQVAGGGVVIDAWYTLPAGMRPERNDAHVRLTFSSTGAITRTTLETKTTPMK